MTCQKCGHVYCYTHGDQHQNGNCQEYERKHRAENLKNAALISKVSKPCPKCKAPIQKRSGCNHMKCPQCQTAFCWLCGTEIEDTTYPEHFKATNISSACRGKQFEEMTCWQYFLVIIISAWVLIFLTPLAVSLTIVFSLFCIICICCVHDWRPTCSEMLQSFHGIYELWMAGLCYGSLCLWGLVCCVPLVFFFCCAQLFGFTGNSDAQEQELLEAQAEREAQEQLRNENIRDVGVGVGVGV